MNSWKRLGGISQRGGALTFLLLALALFEPEIDRRVLKW